MVAFAGCNELLDNRPGELGAESFATEPADGGAPGSEARRDVDAFAPQSPPPAQPDAATQVAPPPCAVGTKPCGGACVPATDPAFGCGRPTCERCAPLHGVAACVEGACAVGMCEPGFADCNASATDGCETDLAQPASCGACGAACAAAPNAAGVCAAGACALECQPGFGDCNGNPADGCEANLLTDRKSCGACGTFCIVGKCKAGVCVWKL
jgi:hypothetical protein